MSTPDDTLETMLSSLYGQAAAPAILERLQALMGTAERAPLSPLRLSQRDAVLITYGDHVSTAGQTPLASLHHFLTQTIKDTINTIHVLPFYPSSSDDGFSVIDYTAVNPALGTWDDLSRFHADFWLMIDAVFNHISAESDWFQAFLRGEPPYDQYFITVDPAADLSQVRRPRALPLLTRFDTTRGEGYLWTTFSADQIDLNVANPDVLLELLKILLFYVQQGADLIRLDAIGFLWKTIGTSCIHLPQTHTIIQLMREMLNRVAPDVLLVTETNVPHAENISYFGDGSNEAQMVYQFSLPPLILHTFRTGDSRALNDWAATIHRVSDRTTFFNFTASHDGIGVQPARGILPDSDIEALVAMTTAHGGFVSYKNNPDGTQSPYELNITYFDAINPPDLTRSDPTLAVQRFICSQAIMLAFMGVPGIYFNSLFGCRNDLAGVQATGRYRSINRQKFAAGTLLSAIAHLDTLTAQTFHAYQHLLDVRYDERAFHPLGNQQVLEVGSAIFALERLSPDGGEHLLALHNITGSEVSLAIPITSAHRRHDLVSGQQYRSSSDTLQLTLRPYQVIWLKPGSV